MTYGINEFMITKTLHIIIALWAICLACVSCSQDNITQPVSMGDGQVKIVYKGAGTSLSRTPEDGWDGDWNENAITRVDLFVFNADNTLFRHLDPGDLTTIETEDGEGYTVAETEQLTYSEATADKKYYMIANCPQLETTMIEDLSDLQAVMINPDLDCDAYQSGGFVMDDEGDFTTIGELSTLTFNLERAAVKIRLSVFGADGKTSIIDQCSFRLYNYVSDGTYVMIEHEDSYYKVPVNFSIANDNDKYFENTEEEKAYIKDIRDKYYRIKRNHIYDIKVKIDMETHKETEWEILVEPWSEFDIEVPAFE